MWRKKGHRLAVLEILSVWWVQVEFLLMSPPGNLKLTDSHHHRPTDGDGGLTFSRPTEIMSSFLFSLQKRKKRINVLPGGTQPKKRETVVEPSKCEKVSLPLNLTRILLCGLTFPNAPLEAVHTQRQYCRVTLNPSLSPSFSSSCPLFFCD